jgi:GDPmannose 4,6-dehydratase
MARMGLPPTPRRALVLGAAGQDGSYLAELLVERGYAVTGLVRRPIDDPLPNLAAVRDRIELIRGDVADAALLGDLVAAVRPHEIYNVASTSTLAAAWDDPLACARDTGLAVAALLDAIRKTDPSIRLVQASSAQVFGDPVESPQSEATPRLPADPYAAAKLYADSMVATYRARHGLHASSAILFNHESPRRSPAYVSRKVTRAVAAMARGSAERLALGDLTAVRDWTFAGDVVEGMWLMVQADEPGDLVLASGVGRTVAELVEVAFAAGGVDPAGRLEVDADLVRRAHALPVVGDPSLARERIGWAARASFKDLIASMVAHDVAELDAQAGAGLRSRR